MQSPTVSILIVTWNRREDLLESIQSVYDQACQDFEVIVVDNASDDGTVESLQAAFPAVKLIELDRNLGPSGGRNPGIAAARGEFVFLLDSDASLASDTLQTIVSRFQTDPTLGVITCRILNSHTGELDPSTWIFTERQKADQCCEFPCHSFSECGVAIRREVFDRAGMFRDDLFFGREGEELSLRILQAGYQIVYCPTAIVYHRVSPQKRVAGCEREYLDLRNSLYTYLLHHPWWMLVGFAIMKMGSSFARGAKRGCLPQDVRAVRDVLRRAPALLEQRVPMSRAVARRYLYLQRRYGSLSWDLRSWLKHKA